MKQARQVASPVAPGPAKALVQELPIVLERGLDFALGMVLHVRLPAVGDHPAGDEVVVVRVELILTEPPFLVGEASGELFVLQDVRAIGHGATGHARHPAIHVRGCRTVKVAPFEVQSAEEAVDSLRDGGRLGSSKPLAGHDATKLVVLKGSQHPQERLARPGNIVIRKHNDLGRDFGDGTCHLTSLVGLFDGHAPQAVVVRRWHLADCHLCFVQIVVHSHQDEFFGFVLEDRLDGVFQLLALAVESWQDDGDMLGGQRRFLWRGNWLEGPESPQIDEQAQVAVNARGRPTSVAGALSDMADGHVGGEGLTRDR
jgi:hypothetical protein